MASLDTNVLVRFLVHDDNRQSGLARKFIKAVLDASQTLYIPVTVMLELEWVLRTCYGFDKEKIVATFSSLLASAEPAFESEAAIEIALFLYGKYTADFADCLHTALARLAGENPLWTFDRSASRVEGARLLA